MLNRMIYISTAVGPITTTVTGTILRSAQAYNAANGITGVLCQGRGVYLQVLEGEKNRIESLYERIVLDKRHNNLALRQQQDVNRRRYGSWAMAHVDMSHLEDHQVGHSHQITFDPYLATADDVMAKIDALIAAGKVMDAPVI